MNALIITPIQMYEVIKPRLKKEKKKRCFTVCEKKCLVRNRREYFTMIEIMLGCDVHIIF